MSALELRYDRGRLKSAVGFAVAGTVLFGGLAAYGLAAVDGGHPPRSAVLAVLFAPLLAAACVIGGAVAAVRLFDRSPQVVVTADGVRDRRTGLRLAWADVVGFEVACERDRGGNLLAATLLLYRPAGRPRRVSLAGLDVPPAEVVGRIHALAGFPVG